MFAYQNRSDFNVIDRGNGIVEISNGSQKNFITNVESVQFGDTVYSIESLIGGTGSGNSPVIVYPADSHITISENTSFVVDVNATDLDGDTLIYSIAEGSDGSRFTINAQTGELSFISSPDFESPQDSDGDNVYDVTIVVSDGTNSVSKTLWVTVVDEDENGGGTNSAPEFTNVSEGEIVFVNENTTFVGDANAIDADGDTLIYSISDGIGTPGSANNEDAGRFVIDPQTGVLSFSVAPDFENPSDADGDNTYHVTLVVSDGTAAQERRVVIKVQDVNEGGSGNSAPQFTNVQEGEIVDVLENTTLVGDANATDADGDTLTYSISGGADASKFSINSTTGVVSFISAPDFEAPTDADGNNLYQLTLRVSDGKGGLQDRSVTIRVVNVNESFNSAPQFTNVQEGEIVDVLENTTLVGDANATDADGDTLTYSISGGADASRFSINSATGVVSFISAPDFEAPTDADGNNLYQLTLRVADGNGGSQERSVTIRVNNVSESTNSAPQFTNVQEGEIVDVLENTTLVGDANATDADGDTLTYSISGGADASRFSINSATGVVSFISAPDFEAPTDADGNNLYQLTLRVSDGNGGSQERSVTIRVNNVNEGGTGGNQAPYFTNVYQNENVVVNEGTTFVGDADAFDADGDTLTYSIVGGVDSALFVINPTTGSVSFVNAPNFESPSDNNGDNFFEIRLRVSDGQAFQDRDVLVSVDDVAEGSNQSPRFTNVQIGDFVNVNENTTFVGDADATDPDGDAFTFSIAGGVDAALFTINAQTGVVSFINAPDFENPGDSDGDNSYGLIIRVSDGVTYQDRLVWVELLNVAD